MTVGELLVLLGLSSGPFTAGLAKAQGQMRGFAAETQSSSASASASMAGAGLAATALGLAVVGVGVLSARSAVQFQSSMELIRTQAGGTQHARAHTRHDPSSKCSNWSRSKSPNTLPFRNNRM